jgi:hypothetical protein
VKEYVNVLARHRFDNICLEITAHAQEVVAETSISSRCRRKSTSLSNGVIEGLHAAVTILFAVRRGWEENAPL